MPHCGRRYTGNIVNIVVTPVIDGQPGTPIAWESPDEATKRLMDAADEVLINVEQMTFRIPLPRGKRWVVVNRGDRTCFGWQATVNGRNTKSLVWVSGNEMVIAEDPDAAGV